MGDEDLGRKEGRSSWLEEKVLKYDLESLNSDINDCRLQITRKGQPRWYRERSLSAEDEIVDRLIDAKTGREVWTSQKPLRGWYLYLTAPTLPRNATIPLLPVRGASSGSTPLSLAVGTRLDSHWLGDLDDEIFASKTIESTLKQKNETHHDSQFTAISLDGMPGNSASNEEIGHAIRTQHSRSSSHSLSLGHARRRSGGGHLKSDSTSRNVSRSSIPGGGEMLREVYEEEDETGAEQVRKKGEPKEAPYLCRFLLTEGGGARTDGTQKTSWARWAWKGIPIALGTPLDFDSSKTFSIMWTNAPPDSRGTISPLKEILRYQDDSSWSNWRGKRRGAFLIQHAAVRALRIETDFWIATAMAYLAYIEERDGYRAAMDG